MRLSPQHIDFYVDYVALIIEVHPLISKCFDDAISCNCVEVRNNHPKRFVWNSKFECLNLKLNLHIYLGSSLIRMLFRPKNHGNFSKILREIFVNPHYNY